MKCEICIGQRHHDGNPANKSEQTAITPSKYNKNM